MTCNPPLLSRMTPSPSATIAATPSGGFYLRRNLADTAHRGPSAPYCQSPDNIQSDVPVLNPQLLCSSINLRSGGATAAARPRHHR